MDSCQGYTSNLDPGTKCNNTQKSSTGDRVLGIGGTFSVNTLTPQEALPCTSVLEVFQAVAGDINRFLYLAVYAYCGCSCTVNYIIIVYGTKCGLCNSLDNRARRSFYISLIPTSLLYGSNAFSLCLSITHVNRLITISKRAQRISFGYPPSAHTAPFMHATTLSPLTH